MTKPEWIHVYLCVAFWFALFGLVLRLACLVWSDYPRTIRFSREWDACCLMGSIALTMFVWWLAWG